MTYSTVYGLMRQQENGSRHRGAIRSAEARQRMRDAAIGRKMPSFAPTPLRALAKAAALVQRGEPQRHAALAAGVSLGALQRHLKSIGA